MNQPFPYVELPPQLAQAAIALHEFGVHEVAWSRSDVLVVLEHLAPEGVPVVGGDVLSSVRPLRYAYANWHATPLPGEGVAEYADRSLRAAREYIERYPDNAAWFVLVLGKPAAGAPERASNEF